MCKISQRSAFSVLLGDERLDLLLRVGPVPGRCGTAGDILQKSRRGRTHRMEEAMPCRSLTCSSVSLTITQAEFDLSTDRPNEPIPPFSSATKRLDSSFSELCDWRHGCLLLYEAEHPALRPLACHRISMSSLAPEPIQAGSPHKTGFRHHTDTRDSRTLRVLVIGSATMTEHPLQSAAVRQLRKNCRH